jgi:hypothetical protein
MLAVTLSALVLASTSPSWAQSSPRFRLTGGLTSCGATSSSSAHGLVGESGSGLTAERSSGEFHDAIGGSIGAWFSSRARGSLETGEAEYVSIAFPLQPSDRLVTSVLDELGEADVASWRLGHWSPEDSAYVEAAEEDEMEIERGEGYFLITADPTPVFEEGLAAPIGDFEIDLEDGPEGRPAYNQLGNPFLFPIAVADLTVTDGNETFPLLGAGNRLTEAAIKVYDPETGSYITNPAIIETRTAFWVKKLAPGTVAVVIPYRVGTGGEEEEEIHHLRPAGSSWALALTARQGSRQSEPLVVGAAPVASGEWNPLCVSRAPDPPSGGLGLSIRETGWDRMSGDYVRVFRSPDRAMSWDFTVRAATVPGEIALDLDAIDVPAGARIQLTDLEDGWTRDVASGEGVTLAAKPARSLRLTISFEAGPPSTPLSDGLRYVYPNPFRGRAGLVFTLRGGAPLEARIYDIGGRFVRALSAPAAGSGERVLLWDGRDDNGRKAPPGVYLARYRAGRAQGTARLVKIE